MSSGKEFSRTLSQSLRSLCRGFFMSQGKLTYRVKEVHSDSVPDTETDSVLKPFIEEGIKIRSDPNYNRGADEYRIPAFQGYSRIRPRSVELELFPLTFACSRCNLLHKFHRGMLKGARKCRECKGPLKQLTMILVCRHCGRIQEVFDTCPECNSSITVAEELGHIRWTCTNPDCSNSSKESYLRRFDYWINVRKIPGEYRCQDECHNANSGLDWPLRQTRARPSISQSDAEELLVYVPKQELTRSNLDVFGLEKIESGDMQIHTIVFGYSRHASFQDREREITPKIEAFPPDSDGKMIIYYNFIESTGVRLTLDEDALDNVCEDYLKNISPYQKENLEYMKSRVKSDWTNVLGGNVPDANDAYQVEGEATRRILLHTIKHALLVESPRFCGLDYGEIAGKFKTSGMVRSGDRELADDTIYLYDNMNYGSGVVESLVSDQEVFEQWIHGASDRLKCTRNRCPSACKSCLYLPNTICSHFNGGLDRNLALRYFNFCGQQIEI